MLALRLPRSSKATQILPQAKREVRSASPFGGGATAMEIGASKDECLISSASDNSITAMAIA